MGRPARISREAIAEAANEIGLTDLTLRAVADRLGVSIAGIAARRGDDWQDIAAKVDRLPTAHG